MTPEQCQTLLNEAQATLETGDLSRASALFKAVLESEGADAHQQADAEAGLGETALSSRRFSEAAEHFHRAAHLDPGASAWLHYRLGEASFRAGDWPKAISAFREALDGYGPDDAHARAEILGRLGRARVLAGEGAGEADLREAIRLDPAHAALYADLGDCLLGRKAWDLASEAYGRAHFLDPGNPQYQEGRDRARAISERLQSGL